MLFFFFYEMVHLYWRLNSETRKKLFLGCSTLVCFWVCFSFIIWCCEQLLWTICVVQKKKRNKNKKLAQASVSTKRQLASSQMILSSWLPNKDCCNMVSAFILFVDTFFFFLILFLFNLPSVNTQIYFSTYNIMPACCGLSPVGN